MTTIVTRSDKGSKLTWAEMDANLTNLNNDKLEVGSPASSIAITPVGELTSTNVQDVLSELDSEVTNKVIQTSATGAAIIPTGTTVQRPGSPVEGHFRRNSELGQWEGYDGSQWSGIGGASSGGGNPFCYENDIHITTDYTITSGKNAMSAGPIFIDDGVTVTIPDDSTWSVV